MNKQRTMKTETHTVVRVLHPDLERKMAEFRLRIGAIKSGYPVLADWHANVPEGWGDFPKAPFDRSVVYKGDADTWSYSHHQSIARFGEKIVVSWSNGIRDEDHVGQEIHFAWSTDGKNWSRPQVLVHTPVDSDLIRNNAGLYAANGRLYCYIGVTENPTGGAKSASMNRLGRSAVRLDVYETADLRNWTQHEGICPDVYLFEAPRPSLSGRLVCAGFSMSEADGMALIWDDPSDPASPPRAVKVPTYQDGPRPEQGTWYQTGDGRIWMYNRDRTMSGKLALSWSDDGGDTWHELLRTDFPNTYSRAYAGRLNDGRFYIAGNNYDRFLDREHLQIALSDDGHTFNRQYTLVEGTTTRRVNGLHKENGYHYPNCCPDGDNLLVTYSVNKEDIEVGILDTTRID